MIARLAWRSFARNRRRTAVTVLAMGFAGAIMIFYSALLDGYMGAMRRSALSMDLGELQIHAEGYRRDPDLYRRVTDEAAVLERLDAAGFAAAGRLYGFALAAVGDASAGVQLRGVQVEREREVTRIHENLASGTWIDAAAPREVVIGRKLARTLAVKIGDELVVVGQAADGSMANELYRVRGILRPISDAIDRAGVFLPIGAVRELMAIGDGVHEIAVVGRTPVLDLEAARRSVAAAAPDAEVLTWRELQPVLARLFDMSDGSKLFMLLIVYVAVGMVVLNATLMGVFERIREFGVMKAVGVTPGQIARLVLGESLFQVGIAAVIAAVFGLALTFYFARYGIDLRGFSESQSIAGVAMDPIWRPEPSLAALLNPIAVLSLVVVLAVIYPGAKAALIRPVQAIHHR
jgi:putative ABC transport system permease protein